MNLVLSLHLLILRLVITSLRAEYLQHTNRTTYVDTFLQRRAPGLRAPKKLWWAKELTPDFHVAGRLSERQIKYAADGGFKSIVSLFHDDEPSQIGDEYLPTSAEAAEIAQLAGLDYRVVLESDNCDWASVVAVEKISAIIPTLKKPILLHCNRAYTIAFTTMMYLANASKHDQNFTPQVNTENIFKMAAVMGLDFTMDFTLETVAKINSETIPENLPQPNVVPEEWYDYWMAHPVYQNWFTAGQIRQSHLENIQMAGFIHVINMRMGVDDENGNPSQEQVTLINVKDGTPTYGNKETGPRQKPDTLKNIVIDSTKNNSFVTKNSDVNFESRNSGEFGDEIGYNEDRERQVLEKAGFRYYHMPVLSGGKFSPELFGKYKDKLLEIGRTGEPVLVHCASAHRVAYMTVLAAALQYNKDLDWALQRTRELGFVVSPTEHKDVYLMYAAWLDSNKFNSTKDEL
ncbi:uncharacterized protein LOC110456117 isoform X1 [Mizuhopecten yessoensis]|uniref:uncharacterized protein LOC110456117 isoform X1 n=1 Tax=Mizuhopecten yessoensis TaxID=6573 RepID=UPI000B45E776|nr:uncharacterized protein LOC110456117 isoform X1 [Mizuhopecten yessoensis]